MTSSTASAFTAQIDKIRGIFRTSTGWFIALALIVGALAGLLTVLQGRIARAMQAWFFDLPPAGQLSASAHLGPGQLMVLPLGGLALGLFALAVRARKRTPIDAVEANALHGGRMSMRDNLIVSSQTLLSNGCGASVGLEAAYAQMGAGAGSHLGRVLRLRRADVRTLVGAGAAGAIAAAFGAPLTGAFYAFEIVIGAYVPSALAPVAAAALAGTFIANAMGSPPYLLTTEAIATLQPRDYAVYVALGALCALAAIAIMRLVGWLEQRVGTSRLPLWTRPAVGGALLIPLAMLTPQALSAGHGALHSDLALHATLGFVALVFVVKCLASIVSLGFGFRGGLFFASLFLGTLLGTLFAAALNAVLGFPLASPADAALVGMAALAAAIVGAPMTMAMLVLEATHDFILASAVMAAVLVASTLVRQVFGYSFSTWRLHLRGETIRSARDVGWIRMLNAGRLMQRAAPAAHDDEDIAEFRKRYPLGSATRVVVEDADHRYAGILTVASAYADGVKADSRLGDLAQMADTVLRPRMDIVEVMKCFDTAQTDELAVVDDQRQVLGVVSESFVRRRYAEELEKNEREMFGERSADSE